MSGSDKLNPQGIKRTEETRKMFPLADPGYTLCGGDFDAFEVSIMDAVYADPKMREDLNSGRSIHGFFGTLLYPPLTYEEIMATKKTGDKYAKAKSGIFALSYGGNAYTLMTRLGIAEDVAQRAEIGFFRNYNVMGAKRKQFADMFCSMKQPNGIGTKVEWNEPADYIESIFGFKRYFTLENMICKTLFNLAENPPEEWKDFKVKVTRRDREQTTVGSVRSALFAAAFAQQAHNMRAAGNHVIQSPGATITKELQRAIWDVQPSGIHDWIVQPLNIHDEIMCPVKKGYENQVSAVVNDFIEEKKKVIPLIAMTWKIGLDSWADK
jgi:DNA polymerase I-like protein with 3'-5' exonuclease and polymerase domains